MNEVEDVLKSLKKRYGDNAVSLGEEIHKVEVISTGSIGLDKALGVGGVPKGRITEIYGQEMGGKTTLAYHIIAEAQKQGGLCAFIDAEHSIDEEYAQNIGVDVSKLIITRPLCGEDAIETVEELIRTGKVAVVVIDSVSALIPRAEIEAQTGASVMGSQARLMSQAMRKLTGITATNNTVVIFINQIRMKIGVMFGCFQGETLVNFVDGRSIPIRDVVKNKIEGKVWSVGKNGFEPRKIVGWHENGKIDNPSDFIHIETTSVNGGGRFGFTCTRNHKILTTQGWKEAREISTDTKLVSRNTEIFNGSFRAFMTGSLVGDSTLATVSKNSVCLKLQDKNTEYLSWKASKIGKILPLRECGNKLVSDCSHELANIKRELGKRDPIYFFINYSDLGLAVWFMDDAHYDNKNGHNRYCLSVKRVKGDVAKCQQIKQAFESLGLSCSFNSSGTFVFTTESTNEIAGRIAKYVPKCMQYKLPEKFKGKYKEFELKNTPIIMAEWVDVVLVREASSRQLRDKMRYDISVAKNKNYMVGGINNGVVVHNSPETTSGGNALKYFASVRMDVRRQMKDKIEEDGEISGNRVKVKIVKNKVAPPMRTAEFDIIYGEGISKVGEILDYGVSLGILEKAGSWYKYKGDNIAQGRPGAIKYLKSNPKIADKIEDEIRRSMK